MDIKPTDLCDIIAAAGKNNVMELNIGEIKILFKKAEQEQGQNFIPVAQDFIEPQTAKNEQLRSDLEQLMIEDPVTWDKLNSSGDPIDALN